MENKPNIVVVGNYNRQDVVNSFRSLADSFNLYFAEFTSPKEEENNYYKSFGKALYWGDFHSAFTLISKIKPHKVIFIFIESYHHMALNLACKQTGITTIVIDHGLRDANINFRLAKFFVRRRKKYNKAQKGLQILSQFGSRFRARLFLMRTSVLLEEQYKTFFKEFCKIRSDSDYETTILKVNSPLCLPHKYLSFSENNKIGHFPFCHFSNQYSSSTIGVPLFDSLANIKVKQNSANEVLFIDQGLNNRHLLGWNDSNYLNFLSELSLATTRRQLHVYIKLHPTQTTVEAILEKNYEFEIINDNKLREILPRVPIVIGFFSTYLLPLASLGHTTVLTLENHPIGRIDVSKSFIEAGVAHPVYSMQDLEWALQHIEQLHQKQLPNKAKFTEEWMYKFDGKAGERLRDILLSDEL